MPGLLDDPMTAMGLGLLGGNSPNFGQNLAQAVQYAQVQQQRQLQEQQLRQQAEIGNIGLQNARQGQSDQAAFRAAQTGAPTSDDPYQDAIRKYKYYQSKGVPESMLKPYLDQIEKLKPKYHVVQGNLVGEPTGNDGQGRSVYESPPEMKVSPSGAVYNPKDLKGGTFLTGPESDVIPDGKGGWMPNPAKLALRKAGAPSVSLNTSENPFLKGFGDKQSDLFFKMRESAEKANSGIQSINNMREAIAGGAWQGGGSNAKAEIANYLKPLGFAVDEEKLKNTKAFASAAGKAMLDHAKDLGANPSNADAARIEKIIGSADTDPGAMGKMLDWQEEMYRKTVKNFNGAYEQVKKNPAVFNAWDLSVKENAPYQPKTNTSAPGARSMKFDKDGNPL